MKLKSLLTLILICSSLCACDNTVQKNSIPEVNLKKKQTNQEKEALEALTQLQINTDIKNSLYLTFGNTNHSQLPSDSSFTISQETFKNVLLEYTSRHHKNIPLAKRIELVEASIKAKESYEVYYCKDTSKKASINNALPYCGSWIIPNVQFKDIVLIWRR